MAGIPDSNIYAMNLDRMLARQDKIAEAAFKLNLSRKQLIYSHLPERKTVGKAALVAAILVGAGLTAYNFEAVKGFAIDKGAAAKALAEKEFAQIKDFFKGKYNHFFGAQGAGAPAPTISPSSPANGGFGASGGGFGWRS